jgi:hypothetical protein
MRKSCDGNHIRLDINSRIEVNERYRQINAIYLDTFDIAFTRERQPVCERGCIQCYRPEKPEICSPNVKRDWQPMRGEVS